MNKKIVFIGGGSVIWTPTFANDLFQQSSLAGSQLVLVDIDQDALRVLTAYCTRLSHQYQTGWSVASADLDAALEGADFVCLSISTGGFEAMHHDYTIPERYGVFHTVGDTAGPGGISRTLRNVPVFVQVARKMEQLCPDAWLIHVTNPLSQLTRAVGLTTKVRCVGLCHNYAGTISMLAGYLGAKEKDIHAVSVGINHYSYLKDLTVRGRPVAGQLSLERYFRYHLETKDEARLTGTTDDIVQQMTGYQGTMEYYLNFLLFEQTGCFPVGSSNHLAENLPYYCSSEETLARYHIRRKGVLPRRQLQKDDKRRRLEAQLNGDEPLPMPAASKESFSAIVSALAGGEPVRSIVAMANQGQVSNLPAQVVVETWAEANGSGIFPLMSGPVPQGLAGWMLTSIEEQELSVAAALSGDPELALRAMRITPMLTDKSAAKDLLRDLLAANRAWLGHMRELD